MTDGLDETRYAAVKSRLYFRASVSLLPVKRKIFAPATPPMFMFLLELKAYKVLDKLEQVSRP